jgi:hypothetical protein
MRFSPLKAISLIAFSAALFACADGTDTVAPAPAAPSAVVAARAASHRPPRIAGRKNLGSSLSGMMMRSVATGGIVVSDSTTGTVDAAALAAVLVGSGVTISNARYTGAKSSAGTFTSDSQTVGITSGILLSTGIAKGVIGPNTISYYGTDMNGAGDAQMTALVGSPTFDATTLEFDFVPDSAKIYITKYVFASDEYNEFVGTQFDDGIAIFVNNVNCALVDGQPVSINSINDGYNDGTDVTPPSHPWLFRSNLDPGGNPSNAINTEMDGLTTVLTCAASVNKGVTNHIKIAIADANDGLFDSNLFIGGGSLTTTPPLVAVASYSVVPDCISGGGTVTLDASGTLHSVAPIASVEWLRNGALLGTGTTFTWQHVPPGASTVTLRVTDATGTVSTTTITVLVTAASAPTGTLTASPTMLLPANHQYTPITVTAASHSSCGPAPAYTVEVQSDEPDDAPGSADGVTQNDVLVTRPHLPPLVSTNASPVVLLNPDTDQLFLRAERDLSQTDVPRTYYLTMKIGGVAVASTHVVVPADTKGTCKVKKRAKDDREDKNDKVGGAKNCNNGDKGNGKG